MGYILPRHTVDAKQLAILLEVVRCGSFSKAAEVRNISQPAISTSIAALESRFGTRLLDRNRAGVTATSAGMILVRRAEALEIQLDLADREMKLSQSGIYGPIRIVGAPGALLTLAPSAIVALNRQEVRFEISIVEATDPEFMDMLRNGKADIVLCTLGAAVVSDDIEDIELLTDLFVLVMRPGHDLAGLERIALGALQDASWVLPNIGGAFRRHADALLLNAGLRIGGNVIRCDALGLLKEIVAQTDYLALLPQGVVQSDVAHSKLASRPIDQQVVRRLGMRFLAGSQATPVIVKLRRALQEAVLEARGTGASAP